ncbi:hypothetical protein [Bacteroides sp. 519]|uniref:hypothetical protein n=1 Tax=Bacteroides sp. 519 TaxID=2302937 RepID=UPI0013D7F85C|nr:hypothetical protein [Bacteroides sp. 519]NDV57428.1 hypothetical protein [Bacteroides sp. 519]
MRYRYYTILLVLLPIVFILIHVFIIINVDKTLIHKTIDVKYRVNLLSENIGIQKYAERGGTCIAFETTDDIRFEREYIGIVQRIFCHVYYGDIIEKKEQSIGLYVNPKNLLLKKTIPFISLGKSNEKDFWHYIDLYSYVKKQYSAFFLTSYLILYLILFSICMNIHIVSTQKVLWIITLLFPVFYMLI